MSEKIVKTGLENYELIYHINKGKDKVSYYVELQTVSVAPPFARKIEITLKEYKLNGERDHNFLTKVINKVYNDFLMVKHYGIPSYIKDGERDMFFYGWSIEKEEWYTKNKEGVEVYESSPEELKNTLLNNK